MVTMGLLKNTYVKWGLKLMIYSMDMVGEKFPTKRLGLECGSKVF